MPRCIVKQPNDRYAVWSTVVDDFVLLDATAEEAIDEELNDVLKANYPGGKDALRRDLCREEGSFYVGRCVSPVQPEVLFTGDAIEDWLERHVWAHDEYFV